MWWMYLCGDDHWSSVFCGFLWFRDDAESEQQEKNRDKRPDNLVTVNVARAAHLLPPDPTLPCVSVCLVLWFGLHQLLRKILVKGQETYTQT
ncbi:Hypothetical protein SMAX5B_015367 [Scophthalmus maximus]|uniref:Uncharacterized protein n=1 Tax=Scophthalmus maximus TaxID=52904 RepID=A0A2U9BXX8_SCOMX|nr:Hypothetical protein SMAX5B_015367 [Scophthalmus maximus]